MRSNVSTMVKTYSCGYPRDLVSYETLPFVSNYKHSDGGIGGGCRVVSGGSRNLERGVQSVASRKIFGVATPTFGHANAFIIKYSWKAEPRGLSQKKSRTLSDSVVLVNHNFN